MSTIEEILAEAEAPEYRRVATAKVLFRQDLIQRHEQLEADLGAVKASSDGMHTDPRALALARELDELEAEMESAKRSFRFARMGKREWADLLAKHPPTKKQLEKLGNERLDHNPETFPIAAIAASAVDPVMSEEDVLRLEKTLTTSQFDLLWIKCLDANVGGVTTPKSKAAGRILGANDESESTAAPEESPGQSS